MTPAGEETVGGEVPRDGRVLGRARDRLRSSLSDALAAGGGVLVWIGVLLIALDVYNDTRDTVSDSGDGWTGALIFVALTALAVVALHVAPRAVHAGCVAALVLSVPTIYGFLIFPTADSFGDVRAFLALTILTWGLFFAVSSSRGRPILLALAATLLYLWMLGEVADTDAYFAAPVPSPPYATPVELVDAIRGGTDDAQPAAFRSQEITIEDLDESDPLYPLAVQCDEGDLQACDELWSASEIDSDFEEFAATCGGDATLTFPCSDSSGNDDGEFNGVVPFDEFEDEPFPSDPLDQSPLGPQDENTLEIGLVSLLFGAGYLAALRVLDQRRMSSLGTAFVLPGAAALVIAAAALGEESDSAIVGGLMTIAAGLAIGIVGFFGDRRFTTWAGGAIASVGALIIAADVSPEPEPSDANLDLIGAGLVVIAFGLGVVALAWLLHRLLDRRRPGSAPPELLPPSDQPSGGWTAWAPDAAPAPAPAPPAESPSSVWAPPRPPGSA